MQWQRSEYNSLEMLFIYQRILLDYASRVTHSLFFQ